MQIEPIISIVIALFLIAVREGLVIADMQDNTYKSKILSGWWHKMGMVIRGFLILSVFLQVQEHHGYKSWVFWGYVGASFVLASVWYNIAINLITGNKWYYLSNKGIDGFIKKIPFSIKRIFKKVFKRFLFLVLLALPLLSSGQFNAGKYQNLGTAVCTDPDGDEVYFTITAGNTDKYFQIYPCSGLIQVDTIAYTKFLRQKTWYITIGCSDPQKNIARSVYKITLRKSATGIKLSPIIVPPSP